MDREECLLEGMGRTGHRFRRRETSSQILRVRELVAVTACSVERRRVNNNLPHGSNGRYTSVSHKCPSRLEASLPHRG